MGQHRAAPRPGDDDRKFINALLSTYPNNSWTSKPIGEVCQAVQRSAYPDRYQYQVADAQRIVDALGQAPAAPVGMTGFASADFNGDGKPDLAAVEASTGKMFLYPGNGLGTFGQRTLIGTGWDSVGNVTPGDFNGDGKTDLAAVGAGDGSLYVYPGTGTGVFGAPWSAGTGWNTLDNFSAGDFNGDGKSDIAAVGTGDGKLYVYPGTGTGWFAAPVSAGTGWNVMRDLVGGDFNADGRTDIAAVQAPRGAAGNMYLYPGTGQNTFGTRTGIGTDW
ncbi:FG-GAP repeat domain-containing protein [Kitasatospora purpeofusca]|uniref:FG-GAP repeat domain-containing protein n=1 Tax=Kitasatospora purpeofusca TaxID=67352 RepID=UPI00068A5C4B|nr:VCBS repeat-containing protein [Kitasatospora purpeofusca]